MWRIDRGETLPPIPLVRAWLDACGVDAPERDRLLDLAESAHGETRPWRELLDGSQHLQDQARDKEQEATRVRNFQPTVVAGLLQTPEYATHLIPLADITAGVDHAAAVAARLQRQQVLYDKARRFQFLMTEHVLRWSPGPPELLTAQLDRITSLAALDTVDVAVLPDSAAVATPWHNFIIFESADSAYVTTELVHGAQEIHDEREVELFTVLWDKLWGAAVVGADAVSLISEMARRP